MAKPAHWVGFSVISTGRKDVKLTNENASHNSFKDDFKDRK